MSEQLALGESAWVLSEAGPFAQSLKGFAPREVQKNMASAVENCIDGGGQLAVEAGTGTGKTLAYLVPAILSEKRILISTGTKTLQDQLFGRDLPLALKTLKAVSKIALLKGRANYLCRYRLRQTREQGLLQSRHLVSQLQAVQKWSQQSHSGDLAEGSALAEDSQLIPLVTSTVDNCLGSNCPDYENCFLVKARQRALEADILVINHYLFFADLALKDDGFGELLPKSEVIIFDESHQLADIARTFLGERFASKKLQELSRDVRIEYAENATDTIALAQLSDALGKCAADWRLVFGVEGGNRENWQLWRRRDDVKQASDATEQVLDELATVLKAQGSRSPGLESCHIRCQGLLAQISGLWEDIGVASVRWLETYAKNFAVVRTPLDIREPFQSLMTTHRDAAWIFTSATLSVSGSMRHFLEELSLEAATTDIFDSPFDFANRAILYMPRYLAEPNQHEATEQAMSHVRMLLELNQGNAFVLLTSYRALDVARAQLRGIPSLHLLYQGDAPRGQLLETFRQQPRSVLVATGSFWEGVDVAGDDLSLVIIDRLPFSSPSDPVIQARSDYLRRQGGDPFARFQLPEAAISLKQGAGRLIRTVDDSGILAILDPRLVSRRYGEQFLESLPNFRRTRDLSTVREFIRQHPPAGQLVSG